MFFPGMDRMLFSFLELLFGIVAPENEVSGLITAENALQKNQRSTSNQKNRHASRARQEMALTCHKAGNSCTAYRPTALQTTSTDNSECRRAAGEP